MCHTTSLRTPTEHRGQSRRKSSKQIPGLKQLMPRSVSNLRSLFQRTHSTTPSPLSARVGAPPRYGCRNCTGPRSTGSLEPSRRAPLRVDRPRGAAFRPVPRHSLLISRGDLRQSSGECITQTRLFLSHVPSLAPGGSQQQRRRTTRQVRARALGRRCRGARLRKELLRDAGSQRAGTRRPRRGHGAVQAAAAAAAAAGRRPRGRQHPRRRRAQGPLGPDNALVRGGVLDASGRGGFWRRVRQGRRRRGAPPQPSRVRHVPGMRGAGEGEWTPLQG